MAEEKQKEETTECKEYFDCFFMSGKEGEELYNKIMQAVYEKIQMGETSLAKYVLSQFGEGVGERLNKQVFVEIAKEAGAWMLANCNTRAFNRELKLEGKLLLPCDDLGSYSPEWEQDLYSPRLILKYGKEHFIDTYIKGGERYLVSSPYFELKDSYGRIRGLLRTDTTAYEKIGKRAGRIFYILKGLWEPLCKETEAGTFGKVVQQILDAITEGKVNPEPLITLIQGVMREQGLDRNGDICENLKKGMSTLPPAKEYVGETEISLGRSTMFAVWPDRDQWRKAIFSADKVRERYYRPLFGHASKEESKPASLRIYNLPTAKIGEILQGNLKAPTIEEETFIDPANVAKAAFYTDFLVQSYTCNKTDATQTLPTFGDTHLFFMNNPLTNISINGIVMNTPDFPWKDRLLLYYDMLLKGSALVPQEKVAVLLLDGWAHMGFITNLQITNTAERENAADFIFNFISLLDIPSPITTQQIINEPEGNYEVEKQELGEIPETKVYGDYAGYKKETPVLRIKHKSLVDRILSAIVPGLNTRTIRKLSNAFEGVRKFGWRGAWGQAQNFSRDYKIAKKLGISMFDYDVRLPNK